MTEAVTEAAARYLARGVVIEVGPGGVPVNIDPGVRGGQGRAHYDSWCHGAGCNQGHGVWIHLLPDLGTLLPNSLDHEIAHVLSGWGGCVGEGLAMADSMHLERGHVVSNGNTGYAAMAWTAEDQELVTSCDE